MRDAEDDPVCYVLGVGSQIGLSIIREVGQASVRVIALATSCDDLGLESRYAVAGEIVSHVGNPEGIDEIRNIGFRYGRGYLIAISEQHIRWLIEHEDEFGLIVPIVPRKEAFEAVLDKERTLILANALGISTPASIAPVTLDEFKRAGATIGYPVVLKWRDPNVVGPLLRDAGIPLLKAEYIYSDSDLALAGERYASVGTWPLVQEYCPGRGFGQFFLIRNGVAERIFQHVRIAEWPPEGGFSSVCEGVSLRHFSKLQEQSIRLLREIGWEGVAMVEYRYDDRTDRFVLMEVNGRFWGSYPLAYYSGAQFALALFHSAAGVTPKPVGGLKEAIRCRSVLGEMKRLHRIIFQREKIRDRSFQVDVSCELIRFVRDFIRPNVRYYVWSVRDPWPFWRDVLNEIKRFIS